MNQLTTEELAAHKLAMDDEFSKNQLKPGDPGFEYDKVVNFSKRPSKPLEDDSWADGPEDDAEEGEYNDENEYFDDDFENDFN